jgi:hypothetical protein
MVQPALCEVLPCTWHFRRHSSKESDHQRIEPAYFPPFRNSLFAATDSWHEARLTSGKAGSEHNLLGTAFQRFRMTGREHSWLKDQTRQIIPMVQGLIARCIILDFRTTVVQGAIPGVDCGQTDGEFGPNPPVVSRRSWEGTAGHSHDRHPSHGVCSAPPSTTMVSPVLKPLRIR